MNCAIYKRDNELYLVRSVACFSSYFGMNKQQGATLQRKGSTDIFTQNTPLAADVSTDLNQHSIRKDSEQTKQMEDLQKQNKGLMGEREHLLEEIERILSGTGKM